MGSKVLLLKLGEGTSFLQGPNSWSFVKVAEAQKVGFAAAQGVSQELQTSDSSQGPPHDKYTPAFCYLPGAQLHTLDTDHV